MVYTSDLLFDTAIDDLRYHLNFDKKFKQTEYYQKYYKKEINDFWEIASGFTTDEIKHYAMQAISASKIITQTLKKTTILGKDFEGKDLLSKVNRVVKPVIEQLNPDQDPNKILDIPEDIFTNENIELIKNSILKFIK